MPNEKKAAAEKKNVNKPSTSQATKDSASTSSRAPKKSAQISKPGVKQNKPIDSDEEEEVYRTPQEELEIEKNTLKTALQRKVEIEKERAQSSQKYLTFIGKSTSAPQAPGSKWYKEAQSLLSDVQKQIQRHQQAQFNIGLAEIGIGNAKAAIEREMQKAKAAKSGGREKSSRPKIGGTLPSRGTSPAPAVKGIQSTPPTRVNSGLSDGKQVEQTGAAASTHGTQGGRRNDRPRS